jgi:DNA-binding MarR family transcriptional regulator
MVLRALYKRCSLAVRLIDKLLKSNKKEKYLKKVIKFNEVSTEFKSTSDISENKRKLLHILETRSENNNGDTKITTTRLAEVFKVCTKTIQRWLKYLEDNGYIRRLTIPYKSSVNAKCYADRTIRCLRIFLKKRLNFKPDLKWKRDYRPDFDLPATKDISTGRPPAFKWYMPAGSSVMSAGKTIKAAWSATYELFKMNIIDPEQEDMLTHVTEAYEIGSEDPFVVAVLGKRFQKGTV